MNRRIIEIPRSGCKVHRVTITDDPSEGGQVTARRETFLRELIDQDLLRCGPQGFEQLVMRRLGDAWVVELTATEETE